MKNKEIFKVGDTVYHYVHGKGEVVDIFGGDTYAVIVDFGGVEVYFAKDEVHFMGYPPSLSFTPYDLVNGGFSQERPLPDIEVDTLVYVRCVGGDWRMRYFSHFSEDGYIRCFHDQKKSTDSAPTVTWDEWSLTNPLEEK